MMRGPPELFPVVVGLLLLGLMAALFSVSAGPEDPTGAVNESGHVDDAVDVLQRSDRSAGECPAYAPSEPRPLVRIRADRLAAWTVAPASGQGALPSEAYTVDEANQTIRLPEAVNGTTVAFAEVAAEGAGTTLVPLRCEAPVELDLAGPEGASHWLRLYPEDHGNGTFEILHPPYQPGESACRLDWSYRDQARTSELVQHPLYPGDVAEVSYHGEDGCPGAMFVYEHLARWTILAT